MRPLAARIHSLSGDLWTRESTWLWLVLIAGLLLRLSLLLFYTPTIFNYYGGDSTRYMRLGISGVRGLFGDIAMPAGYPAFLAVLRHIDAWLPFTIGVQHLLGLATALLLFAAVRRVGAPRWAALLPVLVILFSGDELFIEHGILTEALWIPMLALAMYMLARSLDSKRPIPWLVAGGSALACASIVRSVSDVLPLALAVWVALVFPGSALVRIRHALALLIPAAAVLGVYFLVANPISGGYSGLTEDSGFSLYSRVAQFADCEKFTPPVGTETLCSKIPPKQRAGPFYWAWSPESPLQSRFKFDIHNSEQQERLSRFAKAAVVHQPGDYLATVLKDIARFFVPGLVNVPPDSGAGENEMSFSRTVPTAQGASLSELASQYEEAYSGVGSGVAPKTARDVFGAYQSVVRVHGWILILFVLVGFFGCFVGEFRGRAGAALFLTSGLVLLVLPPLVSSYDIRYSVPAANLLAASAVFGFVEIRARIKASMSPAVAHMRP